MDKLEEKLQELLGEDMVVKSITSVNHDPHPFTIGGSLVTHAANFFSNMLGEAAIRDYEKKHGGVSCAHPGCNISYTEHHSEKALFLQLKRNFTNKEATKLFVGIKPILIAEKIAGITFVETPEKYRIEEATTDQTQAGARPPVPEAKPGKAGRTTGRG